LAFELWATACGFRVLRQPDTELADRVLDLEDEVKSKASSDDGDNQGQ
jgi:hypothetical protein